MKSFYSKTFFLFIRIVSCVFIAILLYLTCRAAYLVFAKQDYIHLFELILGPPSLVILVLVIFKPERLTLFVPSLIFFSVANSIGNSNPAFPIIFMELAAILLWIRSFFKSHKAVKIAALLLLYLVPLLFNLRFGIDFFVSQLFDIIQIILITFCMIFILYEYQKAQVSTDKVLNLADFPETSERDAKWLRLVQKGVKYEAIAIDYSLTLGTVQNRLNKIYHILETGDRIGFLSLYSNAKIVFQK